METEEEKTIPKEALKDVLNAYDKVYQRENAALNTFCFKMEQAKLVLLSLLSYVIDIIIVLIFWIIAASLHLIVTSIIALIVVCLFALLFIFSMIYFQPIPGKEIKKLRFKIVYHISCLRQDLKEIKKFRKKFNIKASTLALIWGTKNANYEAFDCLSDWAYRVEEDSVQLIYDYKKAFSAYKDYVNLDNQWNICGKLLEIINSGRADNLKEALASFDIKEYQEKIADEIKSARLEAMWARSEAASARAEARRATDEARRRY